MAPHGEAITTTYTTTTTTYTTTKPKKPFTKPPKLSTAALHRTKSDISFELSKESLDMTLPTVSEVEDAKCECCGMSEECTPEYIECVRSKYSGKWICGLCTEAVKEEMEKNGGNKDEALSTHMNACARFNKFGRAYPVLSQAEAMRQMFRRSLSLRAKSISPREKGYNKGVKGGIARSSSCIPALSREINDLTKSS